MPVLVRRFVANTLESGPCSLSDLQGFFVFALVAVRSQQHVHRSSLVQTLAISCKGLLVDGPIESCKFYHQVELAQPM